MKVYGKCENCLNEIAYRTSVNTRVEFVMQKGDIVKLKCKNCDITSEFHVDELYAKPSKATQIIAGLIFLIGTPLTFFLINPIFKSSRSHYVIYIVGGFLLIPILVYAILNKQEQNRVNSFNRLKFKGRVNNLY